MKLMNLKIVVLALVLFLLLTGPVGAAELVPWTAAPPPAPALVPWTAKAPARDCTICPGGGDYCDCWSNIPNGTCGACAGVKLDLPPVPHMPAPVPPPAPPAGDCPNGFCQVHRPAVPAPVVYATADGVRVCDQNGCRLVPFAATARPAVSNIAPWTTGVTVGAAGDCADGTCGPTAGAAPGGRLSARFSQPFLQRSGPVRGLLRAVFGGRCGR